MTTLTLRATKGSPLTNAEMDANFTALSTDIGTKLGATGYNAADILTKLKTVDGTGSGLDADLLHGLSPSTSFTGNTIVQRDSSGNFSANLITSYLTGNVTGNVTGNLTGNVTGNVSGNAGTVTNGVYTTDTGTVTAAMLAGSITSSKLTNTGVSAGTYGATGIIPSFTVDAQGRITGATGYSTSTATAQFSSLGVGTAASGTTGEIRATNQITSYYSDDRLKIRGDNISAALDKVAALNGFYYTANDTANTLGYESVPEVGISAQEVQAVLPEVVTPAPIDAQYLTVRYERLVPLLIEAIKELKQELSEIKKNVN
jgi:hypothetical protein